MQLKPVTELPLPSKSGYTSSDLLIVETSDGLRQLGIATFFMGQLHDWVIYRDHVSRKPCYTGEAHSVNCFSGLSVVAWALLPPIDSILSSC